MNQTHTIREYNETKSSSSLDSLSSQYDNFVLFTGTNKLFIENGIVFNSIGIIKYEFASSIHSDIFLLLSSEFSNSFLNYITGMCSSSSNRTNIETCIYFRSIIIRVEIGWWYQTAVGNRLHQPYGYYNYVSNSQELTTVNPYITYLGYNGDFSGFATPILKNEWPILFPSNLAHTVIHFFRKIDNKPSIGISYFVRDALYLLIY